MATESVVLPKRTVIDPNTTISGVANRITVTSSGSDFTITAPQDLAPASSPTFVDITATGDLSADAVLGVTANLSNPGTGAGTAIVRDVTGNLIELTSSRTMKENIKPLQEEIDINLILGLEGKCFNYIGQDIKCFGFIAEELAVIEPKLVIFKDNKPHAIQYDQFIPIIIEYLKTLQVPQESFVKPKDYDEEIVQLDDKINSHCEVLSDELTNIQTDIHSLEKDFNDLNIPAIHKRIDYLDKKLKEHVHEKSIVKVPEIVYYTPIMVYVFIGISVLMSIISLLMR